MELWDRLVKTAFLGTGREPAALPPAADALGNLLGQIAARGAARGADAQAALLGAASAACAYRRAGFVPPKMSAPAAPPCEPDAAPVFGPRASARLARMLGEREGVGLCLPEWLVAAAATGRRVREELLPDLLDAGAARKELRAAVLPVLGRRGLWLAARNPAWAYAAGGDVLDEATVAREWPTADRDRRRLLLSALRAANPPAARELLTSTWKEEPADVRAELVLKLRENLSADDEPFLEAALDDRGQEVRQNAARLLARLPGSAYVRRMTERAKAILAWTPEKGSKKAKVELTPPAATDKAAERDQVQPKGQPYGVGDKAWWAYQIIAAVPPATWADAWNATPQQIVAALGPKNEWRELLLQAWAAAAVTHADAGWARVLAPMELGSTFEPRGAHRPADLLAALPPAEGDAFVIGELRRNDAESRGPLLVNMLSRIEGTWSESLVRAALGWLRDRIEGAGGFHAYYVHSALPGFALRVPPDMLPEASAGWPAEGKNWDYWRPAVEKFLGVLQFRHDMLAAIEE